MLFSIEVESKDLVRGYVVPDGVSSPGRIRVVTNGETIFAGDCNVTVPGIVNAGRHQTGLVGFELGPDLIGDINQTTDLRIYDDQTGFLLYCLPDPLKHVQRRVFRLETSYFYEPFYMQWLSPHFAYVQESVEYYGQETVTQLFHLKNYPSMYFEGRVNMRNFEPFLTEDLLSIVSVSEPFLNLATLLLRLADGSDTAIDGFDEREFHTLSPAFSYFATCRSPDPKAICKMVKRAPKKVLRALASPVTARLTGSVPGESVSRKNVPKALDMLSMFSMVAREDRAEDQTPQDLAQLLGIEIETERFAKVPQEALDLRDALRSMGMLHVLLENDLILYKYLEDVIGAAYQNTLTLAAIAGSCRALACDSVKANRMHRVWVQNDAPKEEKTTACMRDKSLLDKKYETRAPSPQNAVDLFPEWTASFPHDINAQAGDLALFADPRIAWAIEQIGSLAGKSVLELGPLEASHSYMLEQHGASEVLAIEANRQAYLKCLVAKEIFDLKRTRFLLGDFVKFLEETDRSFDVIVASGVLYHMRDPIKLLEIIGKRCQHLVLWTHYFDEDAMPTGDVRRKPFKDTEVRTSASGSKHKLHKRSYLNAWSQFKFCGGPEDIHYWMERDDILSICADAGFSDVRVAQEQPEHPGGPAALFYFGKPTECDPG